MGSSGGGGVGVRLEDHHHLKYTLALTRVGTLVYTHIFSWGFTGTGTTEIKDELFKLNNYSAGRYRKDFNTSQRKKLDGNAPFSELDITIIYKLMQLVCGLSPADDTIWTTESSDSLEYCLNVIKNKRNEIAHDNLNMAATDLDPMLEELRDVFETATKKAGQSFNVDSSMVDNLLKTLNADLDAIRDSPVPVATLAEYEQEILETRKAEVLEAAGKESAQMHNSLSQVGVAPWLITGQTVNIDSVFTSPILKRNEMEIRQRQLSMDKSYVKVHDILKTAHCDGTHPQITLLSALSGMGKSSLIKYLLNRAACDRTDVENMDKYDLILPLDCRHHTFASPTEIMNLLLPRTASMFQQDQFKMALLSLDLLIVMDNLDELDQVSLRSFTEFLRTVSQESRVLATVSREKAHSVQSHLETLNKNVLLLEIEGIPEDKTLTFLQKTLRCLPQAKNGVKNDNDLCALINLQRSHLQDHLKSPEVLSLISLSWALSSGHINTTTTVTEVFMLVEELLTHKVLQNLPGFTSSSISTQNSVRSSLKKFLLALGGVAAECIKKGTYAIDADDLEHLTQECRKLNLPGDYMISAFLNYTDDTDITMPLASRVVSFPRRSTLQYYASCFILHRLRSPSCSRTIREILGLPKLDFKESQILSLQSTMKFLVGMLAVLNLDILKARLGEIVEMLRALKISKASQWLQYIEEAKAEPFITQAIIKEMGNVWDVEGTAISFVLRDILKQNNPQHLILTTCDSPVNYPHLDEVLKVCDKFNSKLSFHLYHHFWTEKIAVSDEYLNIILKGPSPCKLESFAGRLSSQAIKKLPHSLKKLALHVTVDTLKTLNKLLPSLKDLEMLYLNLDVPTTTDPRDLPHLNLANPRTSLSVDIWRTTVTSIPWACDVARNLSKSYTRLVLRQSELTAGECSRWVSGLRARGVKVTWVVIGSTRWAIAKHRERLAKIAKAIGCSKLDWLKV